MESASFGLGHVDPSPDSNLAIGLAMLYDVPKGTTFYYDETNNIRKFWLTPDDFNAGHNKDFILGGVSYPDDGFKGESYDSLKKSIQLQKTAKEIKFAHVCKKGSDFLTCLKSGKLLSFFRWLCDSNLTVHYTAVNHLYFALADIIDTIEHPFVSSLIAFGLKRELYLLFQQHYAEFYKHLYRYEFPNVKESDVKDFFQFFLDAISNHAEERVSSELIEVLKAGKQQKELLFLSDNPERTIIDCYDIFYLNRILYIKDAEHIFDMEDTIVENINANAIYRGLRNFKFIDSQNDFLIQVSDCIVGLIGRFYEYLNMTNEQKIKHDMQGLDKIQEETFNCFRKYMIGADRRGMAYSQMVLCPSIIDVAKDVLYSGLM